jgi:hypothetical protein
VVEGGITLVAETAFQHKDWAPKLELSRDNARMLIVLCAISRELFRARHVQRGLADPTRERFDHGCA